MSERKRSFIEFCLVHKQQPGTERILSSHNVVDDAAAKTRPRWYGLMLRRQSSKKGDGSR